MFLHATGSVATVERYIPNTQSTPTLSGFAAVAASLLLVGTGASYPVNAISHWRPYVQPRAHIAFTNNENYFTAPQSVTFVSTHEEGADLDVRTISQHLFNIREVLSPSMSELAKDLGITRQALYKWLSGENQPDDDSKVVYINALSNIADDFSAAGLTDAKLLVKMKAFDGSSLIDLVKMGKDWEGATQVLIDEARVMNKAADSANPVKSKAKPTDGWKSSISIPGTSEG